MHVCCGVVCFVCRACVLQCVLQCALQCVLQHVLQCVVASYGESSLRRHTAGLCASHVVAAFCCIVRCSMCCGVLLQCVSTPCRVVDISCIECKAYAGVMGDT